MIYSTLKRVTRQPLGIGIVALVMMLVQSVSLATDDSIVDDRSALQSDERLLVLYDQLATAPTQLEGRLAEDAIWNYWFDQSPTTEARSLLDAAIERREAYDYEAAEEHLNKLIALAPDYSEGYNQRAFIRFLRENYEESKIDLEKTLSMDPQHFGALSGMYHVHSRLGDQERAFTFLAKAVTVHPWIKALPKNTRTRPGHLISTHPETSAAASQIVYLLLICDSLSPCDNDACANDQAHAEQCQV